MGIPDIETAGTGITETARCPICRARLDENPLCGRCGTDFTKTRIIARKAEALRNLAMGLWRRGHIEIAMAFMAESRQLKGDALTGGLLDALMDLSLKRAIGALRQGGPQAALYGIRQILAVCPQHQMAKSLQGFIRSQAAL